MNDLEKPSSVKFNYTPFESKDIAEYFLKLSKLTVLSSRGQKLDVVCKIDKDILIRDLRAQITDKFLLNYLEPIIKEAEDYGIKSITNFLVWVQGNNIKLNYPSSQLEPHTHLHQSLSHGTINTYTVVVPLSITEVITENFWANWINAIEQTAPAKLKILNSLKAPGEQSNALDPTLLKEWWNTLKDSNSTPDIVLRFPNKDEKLTFDFDSKNHLHGIENITNNLYLLILFDGYKK